MLFMGYPSCSSLHSICPCEFQHPSLPPGMSIHLCLPWDSGVTPLWLRMYFSLGRTIISVPLPPTCIKRCAMGCKSQQVNLLWHSRGPRDYSHPNMKRGLWCPGLWVIFLTMQYGTEIAGDKERISTGKSLYNLVPAVVLTSLASTTYTYLTALPAG